MATRRQINERHAEQMRRYRARLKEKGKATDDGKPRTKGAPETRAVIQGLAAAVRTLAAAAKRNPDTPAAVIYDELMRRALRSLVRSGFDPAESSARLTFYTLPDEAKSRRRKADIEKRYWEQPPKPGIPRVTDSRS